MLRGFCLFFLIASANSHSYSALPFNHFTYDLDNYYTYYNRSLDYGGLDGYYRESSRDFTYDVDYRLAGYYYNFGKHDLYLSGDFTYDVDYYDYYDWYKNYPWPGQPNNPTPAPIDLQQLDDIVILLDSTPLTVKQKAAYASNNMDQIFNSMYNWSYRDIVDIVKIYQEAHNGEIEDDLLLQHADKPFIYWLNELFDLRIANLPEQSLVEYASFYIDPIKELLGQFFPMHDTNELLIDLLVSEEPFTSEHALGVYLKAFAGDSFRLHVAESLIVDEKVLINDYEGQLHDLIYELRAWIRFVLQKHKQILGAQRILKAWDSRSFRHLGASNMVLKAHPIYGRMPADYLDAEDRLTGDLRLWDEYGIYKFPYDRFNYALNIPHLPPYIDHYYLSNGTALLREYFPFEAVHYDTGDNHFHSQNYPFTAYLPSEDLHVAGNLSEIVASMVLQAEFDKTKVYQSIVNLMLGAALTDNKFAQDLLSMAYPIYTDIQLAEGDKINNVYGMMLCYIRSILLDLMRSEPEFVDFVTYYYSDYSESYNGTGHCRVDTSNTEEYLRGLFGSMPSFEQAVQLSIKALNVHIIPPFTVSDKLYYDNHLWSLEISGQPAEIDGLTANSKSINHSNSLYMYTRTDSIDPRPYKIALNSDLLKQIQLKHGKGRLVPDITEIDNAYKLRTKEREQAERLTSIYKALLAQSSNKEELLRLLAKELLPSSWLSLIAGV